MHLLLRPIFRQSHPNFRGGRNANVSKIWVQLTNKSSRKIKYKKIPRVHKRFRENIVSQEGNNHVNGY